MEALHVIVGAINGGNVEPQRQRAVFDIVTSVGDMDATAAMCAMDDLDDEVDELLGNIGDIKVRVAWLSRPGRTPQQVKACLAGEKRQTVIAALAGTEGLSPDLYAAILDSCSGVRALYTFAVGPAPVQLRVVALRRYLERASRVTDTDLERLVSQVTASPVLVEQFFTSVKNQRLFQQVLDAVDPAALAELPGTVVGELIDRFGVAPLREAVDGYAFARSIAATVSLMTRLPVTAEQRAAVSSEMQTCLDRVVALNTTKNLGLSAAYFAEIQQRIDAVSSEMLTPSFTDKVMADALAGRTADVVDALEELCNVSFSTTRDLVRTLVRTEALPTQVVAAVAREWPHIAVEAVSETKRSNTERIAALICAARSEHHVRAAVEHAEQPREVLRIWLTTGEASPTQKLSVLIGLDDEELAADMLGSLPAVVLQDRPVHGRTSWRFNTWAAPKLVELMFDKLGSDPHTWALATELANNPAMTVDELCDTVAMATATNAA